MANRLNETDAGRFQESKKASKNHDQGNRRLEPASSDKWAEVLATAERYY